MYIDKLDDLVNEYNNFYHITIKIKPIDAKPSTMFDFGVENNDKNPIFNYVKISRYIDIFEKG